MTWEAALIGFSGLCLSAASFLFGRMFSQSEAVLAEKRRLYEECLREFPVPNDAYLDWTPELEMARSSTVRTVGGPLMLYASPAVAFAVSRYITIFDEADKELGPESEPLHPKFKDLAKAHNDMILEMSRDALGWSMFGYRGKSRIPSDYLEQARKNRL